MCIIVGVRDMCSGRHAVLWWVKELFISERPGLTPAMPRILLNVKTLAPRRKESCCPLHSTSPSKCVSIRLATSQSNVKHRPPTHTAAVCCRWLTHLTQTDCQPAGLPQGAMRNCKSCIPRRRATSFLYKRTGQSNNSPPPCALHRGPIPRALLYLRVFIHGRCYARPKKVTSLLPLEVLQATSFYAPRFFWLGN
jgi:hypothetical protein